MWCLFGKKVFYIGSGVSTINLIYSENNLTQNWHKWNSEEHLTPLKFFVLHMILLGPQYTVCSFPKLCQSLPLLKLFVSKGIKLM